MFGASLSPDPVSIPGPAYRSPADAGGKGCSYGSDGAFGCSVDNSYRPPAPADTSARKTKLIVGQRESQSRAR